MDNLKIYDTRFDNRNNKSIISFIKKKCLVNTKKQHNDKIISSSYILPDYHFCFQQYHIVQKNVQYTVQLKEIYTIFGQKKINSIFFKTRYSMLEFLHTKIGGKIQFPPKKWFGTRNPDFIKKRSIGLQKYLNLQAQKKSKVFLQFIKQIKDVQFNESLHKLFILNEQK